MTKDMKKHMPTGVAETAEASETSDFLTNVGLNLQPGDIPRVQQDQVGTVQSLSFLDPLRKQLKSTDKTQLFMPTSLFIRQEMVDTWNKMIQHWAGDNVEVQALIGSPGVGKSVLFFLYALSLAIDYKKKIMYWRKASSDPKKITLICIDAPDAKADERPVNIHIQYATMPFESQIKDIYIYSMQEAFPSLFPVHFKGVDADNTGAGIQLKSHVSKLRANKEIVLFADGPKHADRNDTLEGGIDFLCSSGGHPTPHNDQRTTVMVSILCGWKRQSFQNCLEKLATTDSIRKIWNDRIKIVTPAVGTNEEMELEEEQDGNTQEDALRAGSASTTGAAVEDGSASIEVEDMGGVVDEAIPSDVTKNGGGDVDVTVVDVDGDDNEIDVKQDVVDLIYYFTGGRIRDALVLLGGKAGAFEQFMSDFKAITTGIGDGAVALAVHGTYGTKDKMSFDRLRTYFDAENDPGQHVQIVDSGYVLSLLGDREMDDRYLSAYKEAVKLEEMTMAGNHFEKMMHQVFIRLAKEKRVELPFDGHIQSTGKTVESVRALEQKKYWIPSVPNFPAIDSAVVDGNGHVLTVQYFAGKRHGFKQRTFKTTFLKNIRHEVGADIDNTFVTYVVPSDQDGRPTADIDYRWRTVSIDVSTMESVMESAPHVFAPWVTLADSEL